MSWQARLAGVLRAVSDALDPPRDDGATCTIVLCHPAADPETARGVAQAIIDLHDLGEDTHG
jgi:hypothetical protein